MTWQNDFLAPPKKQRTMKIDALSAWMQEQWIPNHPEHEWVILSERNECTNEAILERFTDDIVMEGGYRLVGTHAVTSSEVPTIFNYNWDGILTTRTGSWVYEFVQVEDETRVSVLLMSTHSDDSRRVVTLSCVPRGFVPTWVDFQKTFNRVARPPKEKVMILGGTQNSYKPDVEWEDVVLSDELKATLQRDVRSFYDRGVKVYNELGLNPFRKILLAGVPGTGKTMICNAMAKWALDREYNVIYVSGGSVGGSNFNKIERALGAAANGNKPALILLEEMDAFLHDQQKALFLNVLDGVESFMNEYGTLLMATTNYPEAIDERVLKRPGRMDRIYVIPPVEDELVAEQILRTYLGKLWRDEHKGIIKNIVGYPGAFVREMVVYAVTQMLQEENTELPLVALQDSLAQLQQQIKTHETLIEHNSKRNGRSAKLGFGKPAL